MEHGGRGRPLDKPAPRGQSQPSRAATGNRTMHAIIDVASDVGPHASRLAAAGVATVIRYYNHRNSAALPSKCLAPGELAALADAGLAVAAVFQQRGGAGGAIEDFDAPSGTRDVARARATAAALGQPAGSGIYFAVDWDFHREADLARIARYFERVRDGLDGRFGAGVYGSGAVGAWLRGRCLVDHVWLAWNADWTGTRDALASGDWSLFQDAPGIGLGSDGPACDGNVANPAIVDFGARPASAWRPSRD